LGPNFAIQNLGVYLERVCYGETFLGEARIYTAVSALTGVVKASNGN